MSLNLEKQLLFVSLWLGYSRLIMKLTHVQYGSYHHTTVSLTYGKRLKEV